MSRDPQPPLSVRILTAVLLVLLLVLLLPVILLALLVFSLHRLILYAVVWTLWLSRGKDVLFVYSDSPIWRDYMTEQVLPLVRERAVVLNWSERSKWPKWWFPAHILRVFGGDREFNPIVILFRPFRFAKRFRFWKPFRHWKHGRTDALELLVNDLRLSL